MKYGLRLTTEITLTERSPTRVRIISVKLRDWTPQNVVETEIGYILYQYLGI